MGNKSIKIKLLTILLLLSGLGQAQPIIDIYLSSFSPNSDKRIFKHAEEFSEVLVSKSGHLPSYKYEKDYNANGIITSEVKFNSAGGKIGETTWTYNAKGELLKIVSKQFANFKGWTTDITTLSYNDSTGCLSEIKNTFDGKIRFTANVTTDQGKITEVRVLNENGVLNGIERLVYVPQQNMLRVLQYKANEQFIGATTYPIDSHKKIPTSSINREVNEHGDVVVESLPNSKLEQGYYYEYEYDASGNWVEKRTYQCRVTSNKKVKDKKLEYKITRKLTY
ncbi:MAG TPA: hypothetical protein P5349_10600 [Tenuifilaceae bacterium]|nr:hypothetical protein [Tenuifilaceae bacterium]